MDAQQHVRALSSEQKQHLYTEGFVVVPGVVPLEKIKLALRLINQELGKGMTFEEVKNAEKGTYFTHLTTHAHLTSLFNSTPAFNILQSVIGTDGVGAQMFAQIALRFPGALCHYFDPLPWWNKSWHIDGFSAPTNGIPSGEIHNFTALVGVVLSDTLQEFSGNLVVFPGSHFLLEKYFQENGFDEACKGLDNLPGIYLPPPVQIRARAGDIIIAHYLLAHTIAPNSSPNIRYQIYFRINSIRDKISEEKNSEKKNEQHFPHSMKNAWIDWLGMSDIEKRIGRSQIVKGLEVIKPFYADEKAFLEKKKILEEYETLGKIRQEAEKLFDSGKIAESHDLLEQISEKFPEDFSVQLKFSVCLTFGPKKDLKRAEKYIKRAIELYPGIIFGYSVYAQNLVQQNRYEEALIMAEKAIDAPPTDDKDNVKNSVLAAYTSARKLGKMDKFQRIFNVAMEKYPAMIGVLETALKEGVTQALWEKGHKWIYSSTKNFEEGIKIFSEILEENPSDFWATLLIGGCHTWAKRPKVGESFIRIALSLNSDVPNAFALLAQNLIMQGRNEDAIPVLVQMFDRKFPSVDTDNDHKEKILDGLRCAKKIFGASNPEFQKILAISQKFYPNLDYSKIKGDCNVM